MKENEPKSGKWKKRIVKGVILSFFLNYGYHGYHAIIAGNKFQKIFDSPHIQSKLDSLHTKESNLYCQIGELKTLIHSLDKKSQNRRVISKIENIVKKDLCNEERLIKEANIVLQPLLLEYQKCSEEIKFIDNQIIQTSGYFRIGEHFEKAWVYGYFK